MKKQFTQVLLSLIAMLTLPNLAWADREVLQSQFGKQTITVASDEVITFYDPWGTENIVDNSSYNSQSMTVFKAADPGMSVQITFEKIDLNQYNTSYFLYLNLYDGIADADDSFSWPSTTSEVTSSSSLAGMSGTLLAEKINNGNKPSLPAVYTSGTVDGALSVGFMHRNSNKCEGWVAKVKVVKLENMTVTGAGSNYENVVASPSSKKDVTLANAYVTATGVMNPDNVTGISFAMTQNENAVDPLKLKLYRGNKLIPATITADGDGYKFSLNDAPSDGTTVYTIKGDFLGTAEVNAKVQVDVKMITTSSFAEGITPFETGSSVAVANPALVFMTAEPQTFTVGDISLNFYDEGGPDAKYINDSNDRLITFVPQHEGKVAEIAFDAFEIYYSSWGTPAVFKVFSGTSTEGALLWEPSLQADYTSGPGKVLRGIPADGGALTILFNAKTTSTYYIKDGWKATVSEYQPVQMTVTSIEATQTKTTDASVGGQNEALLTFNVQTEGSLNALTLSALDIDLKGTHTQIDKLYLYAVGESDAEPTAAAVGSVSVNDGNVTLTLDNAVTLREGNNYFRLTADVKTDVLPETIIDAAIVSIVASKSVINATNGDPEGQRILRDMVLMSATGSTIIVQEGRPIAFYDEGGKEGGIQAKTNGQVTFLSGDANKKVMVDFTKNEIWHGTYYNQELRIYNGQTVDAANLIKTLQKGETGIVRSTAADGSLTVVLYSDASTTTEANGFEADVTLFSPQPMDFDGITVTAASTETVCAGDAEQDMLAINVEALNTEPAMQVTKMAFSAGENYALTSKAELFFGSSKVGETDITAENYVIELTTPQVLTEGDNHFTLKYCISDEAVNDNKVSAKLISVTALVNNAEKTEPFTSTATFKRTVKNIVLSYADQGTVTKTVNGSIAFETKPTSEYSTKYEAGTDTRTNIFVPKHEGMVCQIDFSSFDVYYASSSYGEKAKFAIYAGQGTTGDKLWELNDNAQQNVGPGAVIRSTAEDGSLTVVFSPNTSSSYYTGNGWKATVSEYQTKDMEVKETEVTQASTADASIGAANQELLTVNVKTDGNLNPLTMGCMKLNLNGTEANISKISVWQGTEKLGEAATAAEVDVTFAEAVTLNEGENLFTVKADVSENATENQTIDAKVVSVKVGSNDVVVNNGDPEGARTLKNQVLMTDGNHGTMNLGLGKTIAIYDDGGPEGDGADGVEATITLAPSGDAESIKLTCQSINFAFTAFLYIYKGSEVNDEKLLMDNKGASKPFSPIIVDGPVTIKYVGKGSYTKPNFAITAEGYKKTNVVVTGITTEDISVNEVLKGQADVKMLKAMVEAKGELNSAKITAFDIKGVDGEAVNNYHIYQTGTTTTFSANTPFDTEYEITNSGTYYFWVTYDVKTDATVGLTASATLNSITVGEETVSVTEPATATITVASGKSGTYTVGGENATYATIQAAVDDLDTLGMEGPVVLNIRAGEYNEKVRIPYIKGMGAVNTLTLQSESGQRDVKIYHNNYTTSGYSDDQHKKDYGVVTLYQANYVTLKNLEITTTDLNYKAVVMVKDESRHATIDNCYLHTDIYASTNGDGPALVGHTIIDEENKNNDYLTVKNCLLEGGKYGVYMGGTSTVALPKEVGGVIEGNTFKNNGRFMLYSYDELGAKIRNNTFIIDHADVKMSNGVIDINVRDEYTEATEITGNVFNLNSSNTLAAIYVRQMEGTATAPAIIANNVVNLASANASCTPFKFSGAKQKYTNIANNTFRMTGTNGGAAFWASSALADGYGNVNVVNNIIQNETNGYAVNLYNDANLDADKINFQNNLIFTAGETFFRAASSTTGDFASFVEKTGATNCINKQVTFFEGSCEPANTLDGDLLKALPLSYVTVDVQGTARPAEDITIGAYEFDPDVTRVPVVAEGYPTATATAYNEAMVTVKADMNGKAYILLLAADAEAPTVETLKSTGTVLTLNKDAEASQKVAGLTENTQYKAYVLVESSRGICTDVLTTETFTTPLEPIDLIIACTEPVTTVASATETNLKVMVASGRAPYTVTWMNSKHEVVGEPIVTELEGEEILLAITPTQSGDYYVTVKDAQQFEASDTCRVIVTGDAQIADFENLYLAPESYWRGPDTKGEIEDGIYGDKQYQGSFVSGSYRFSNNYSIDWSSWSGFSYSNCTATTFESYSTDQWNSCVGKGHDNSDNYAVFFEDAYAPMTVTVLNNAAGEQISGFYITNAAVTVNSFLNGDGMTPGAFASGDYLKLIITADGDDQRTVEYYLADYRSDNEDDWYYVNDWKYVDLSSLGTVKELSFHLVSSRSNAYGYTTPLYFCVDDFGAPAPEGTSVQDVLKTGNTDDGYYYDLQGRRVQHPTRGIYVRNGKKVLIK